MKLDQQAVSTATSVLSNKLQANSNAKISRPCGREVEGAKKAAKRIDGVSVWSAAIPN